MKETSTDPYSHPLLILGDIQGGKSSNQAFLPVSTQNNKVIGFLPLLHRTDVFHTFPSLPLIAFEVLYAYLYMFNYMQTEQRTVNCWKDWSWANIHSDKQR